jgi:hypothetical protein
VRRGGVISIHDRHPLIHSRPVSSVAPLLGRTPSRSLGPAGSWSARRAGPRRGRPRRGWRESRTPARIPFHPCGRPTTWTGSDRHVDACPAAPFHSASEECKRGTTHQRGSPVQKGFARVATLTCRRHAGESRADDLAVPSASSAEERYGAKTRGVVSGRRGSAVSGRRVPRRRAGRPSARGSASACPGGSP